MTETGRYAVTFQHLPRCMYVTIHNIFLSNEDYMNENSISCVILLQNNLFCLVRSATFVVDTLARTVSLGGDACQQ